MFILYIYPGSGSLLLQALLAGFLTLFTFSKSVKLYCGVLIRKFKGKGKDKDESNES